MARLKDSQDRLGEVHSDKITKKITDIEFIGRMAKQMRMMVATDARVGSKLRKAYMNEYKTTKTMQFAGRPPFSLGMIYTQIQSA